MTKSQVQRLAKSNLERQVLEFQVEVQKTLERIFKKPTVFRPGWIDSLRLFNLRMWCLKYNVTLLWVLQTLTHYWLHAKHVARKNPPRGIGVRIPTLVGATSRKVIEEALLRDFPDRENEIHLRTVIEEKYLLSEDVMGSGDGSFRVNNPAEMLKAYKARINRARKGLEELEESLSRRQWRGNPYKAR